MLHCLTYLKISTADVNCCIYMLTQTMILKCRQTVLILYNFVAERERERETNRERERERERERQIDRQADRHGDREDKKRKNVGTFTSKNTDPNVGHF